MIKANHKQKKFMYFDFWNIETMYWIISVFRVNAVFGFVIDFHVRKWFWLTSFYGEGIKLKN